MHEHVASEVFVLNAFLDDCDLHAIGQDLVTGSFVSSDLHLELVQRTSHVVFEGLGKNLELQRCLPTSCRGLILCHEPSPAQQPFAVACMFQQSLR